MATKYPDRRVARSKFLRPGLSVKDREIIIANELRQITRAIEEVDEGGASGASAGYPFFLPENYGWETGGTEADSNSAMLTMRDAVQDAGGGIMIITDRMYMTEPFVTPTVPFQIWGLGRSKGVANGSIMSATGDFDLIKIPYNVGNFVFWNLHLQVKEGVTPTYGVLIDGRWAENGLLYNISTGPTHLGFDFAIARGMVLRDIYMRGFNANRSKIGTGAPSNPDLGFGLCFRATQDLMDGNIGNSNTVYDRDGPGVEYEPKAKGTANKVYNFYCNGKDEDDEAGEAVKDQFNEGFAAIYLLGASTVRIDTWQIKHCEYAIYGEHTPHLDGGGDEDGENMLSGIFMRNGSAEGNKTPYYFDGFEKCTFESNQSNASAGAGITIGSLPGKTWPGVTPGVIPVNVWGGDLKIHDVNIVGSDQEGILVRAGQVNIVNPTIAGYSKAKDNDIDLGSRQLFDSSTSSTRTQLTNFAAGIYVVWNNGENDIRVKFGNSSVVATGSDTLIASGQKKIFDGVGGNPPAPTSGQNYLASISTSGTSVNNYVGKQATYESAGIRVQQNTKMAAIMGGRISVSNSMDAETPDANHPAILIDSGVENLNIFGTDVREGGIVNNAEGEPTIKIGALINAQYRHSLDSDRSFFVTTGNIVADARHVDSLIRFGGGSASTLTIPPASTVPWKLGNRITAIQSGAGVLTVVAGTGVDIFSRSGSLAAPARYTRLVLEYVNEDVWNLAVSAGS